LFNFLDKGLFCCKFCPAELSAEILSAILDKAPPIAIDASACSGVTVMIIPLEKYPIYCS
jgi:hypothetical protein